MSSKGTFKPATINCTVEPADELKCLMQHQDLYLSIQDSEKDWAAMFGLNKKSAKALADSLMSFVNRECRTCGF